MPIAEILLPELRHEMGTTRRVLAVVPDSVPDWRPHPKSSTIGSLAAHIATIPVWGRMTLDRTELDLGVPENAAAARVPFTAIPEMLERFDRNVRELCDAVASTSDTAMRDTWTLKNAGTIVLSMPRVAVLRGFV